MARGYRYCILLVILALLLSPAGVLSAPVEQGGTSYYVVQPGDTLADIAIQLGVSASTLAKANGITNWDFIYVGQRLLIPGTVPTPSPVAPPASPTPLPHATPAAAATLVPAEPTSAPSAGATVAYTVSPGDTLNKIAARYSTTVQAIMVANGLTNPDFIYVGQQLTLGGSANAPQPTPAPGAIPTRQPPPNAIPTPQPAPDSIPPPQRAPSSIPTPQPAPGTAQDGKWIDVNLTEQRLTAYEGQTAVLSVLISSGTAAYPTVVGKFKVNTKVRSQTMSGPGYHLPNVPWVMYFYEAYAIHGAYWHHNFGHPMSHGCLNVTIADAAWLYTWASIGTPVVTHW
jgi:LysM repeat protein